MVQGLSISAVDDDADYLGIEIASCSGRFAGSAFIFAGVDELSELAQKINGFPTKHMERRIHKFGTREPGFAGGFCLLTLLCADRTGGVRVEIDISDGDDGRYQPASAKFDFKTEAAAIDRFVSELMAVHSKRAGDAVLAAVSKSILSET